MSNYSEIRHAFERAADRGTVPQEYVGVLTAGVIQETAVDAFAKTYYGPKLWSDAKDFVRNSANAAAENAAQRTEEKILALEQGAKDVLNLKYISKREAVIATTDLPAILGRARDVSIRDSEGSSLESALMASAVKRTASNFQTMHGIRYDSGLGLFEQAEGANVRYEPIEVTTDGYNVRKFSRAIGFTFEASVNDDLQYFAAQSAALGFAARRNRIEVLLGAIRDQVARSTPSGAQASGGTAAAGGPTVANIEWAKKTLAAGTPSRRMSAIAVPPAWEGVANISRGSTTLPGGAAGSVNPVYNAFDLLIEELMAEEFAKNGGNALDWLAFAASTPWLEFASLRGFEGGPIFQTKLPDVRESDTYGSFDNMTLAFKVLDVVAAKVTNPDAVLRVAGA